MGEGFSIRTLSDAWRGCAEEAWEAYRAGSLPIGAVVADGEGNVVSRGRNRIHERSGENGTLFGQKLAHAEMNALVNFDYEFHAAAASVLYTTTEPCPMCAGAARMADIGGVKYAAREPWAGSAAMFETIPYVRRGEILVEGPPDERLEAVLVALQIEFFLRTRPKVLRRFLEAYEVVTPCAVAVGRELYGSGFFGRMRAEEMSSAYGEVFEGVRNVMRLAETRPRPG